LAIPDLLSSFFPPGGKRRIVGNENAGIL